MQGLVNIKLKVAGDPFRIRFIRKIEKGLVGLGGAYADPEDPIEARLSKVIRNTMTRLHAEIARSVNFYRSTHGGTTPKRVFLCGAHSVVVLP